MHFKNKMQLNYLYKKSRFLRRYFNYFLINLVHNQTIHYTISYNVLKIEYVAPVVQNTHKVCFFIFIHIYVQCSQYKHSVQRWRWWKVAFILQHVVKWSASNTDVIVFEKCAVFEFSKINCDPYITYYKLTHNTIRNTRSSSCNH